MQKPFKIELNEQIKSNYSEEELAQFENAAGLIEKMYADAEILGLGSVIIKNNIIKLDGPAYIKGGRTIIPVRAITEGLGAERALGAEKETGSPDGWSPVQQQRRGRGIRRQ